MLTGLPKNHPAMRDFIARERAKRAKGMHLVIETPIADKKRQERQARLKVARMGRTGMHAGEKTSPKMSKKQLVRVTRRHQHKLPRNPCAPFPRSLFGLRRTLGLTLWAATAGPALDRPRHLLRARLPRRRRRLERSTCGQ